MEVIGKSQDRLSPEYSKMLFKRHLQAALVRSGASLVMGLFAIIAFYLGSIKFHHLTGVGFSILFLILINPPTLWILKKIKSRLVYRYFSLFINFLEIIGYTGVIYSLGGIEATYLTPIYAALITYVGTISPRSFPFIVAALCALAFSSMVTLEYLGYLPHQSVVSDFRTPLATQMIYVSVVMGLLFVIAYISSYTASTLKRITDKLHRKNIELQASVRAMSREITVRKQAEEALRESEEKYRTILESIENGYFEVDIAGNFTFFNDSLCEILGYSKDELMDMNNRQYTDKENAKKLYQAFNKVFTTGKPEKGFDWEIIRKDGKKRSIEVSVSLRGDAEGQPIGFRGIVRDISEKQRLEAEIQHAQRMKSVGTLAGGIAHNFNNLLMGIQGNVSIILLDIDSNNPRHKNLKSIEKLVENGAKLTAQLIGYAREGRYESRPISLNQLVKETSEAFGMMRKEITVHQELSEKLYGIKVDQGQIEQFLLNLYVNAADAMPGGGDLFLKTINVVDMDLTGKPYKVKPGNYVLLTVKDTGVGMDEETKERIFEPFFTTKGLATGTGLGMAAAYGIIEGHGGYIDVDSMKGEGTTFSIYLPATEKMIKEKKALSDELVRGKGTVFLVDDEEMISDAGGQMLKYLGYEVLLANNGQEALELYKKNQDKIDMVLLDMVMPVMGGGEAFDRMKEMNPNVKVLLSSGYSLEGEAKEILKRGCDAFIQKPFKLEELSQKIGEILGKK